METEISPSAFAVFDYLKSKGWGGLYHTAPQFEVMQLSDKQLVACPMPITPLYRGQNAIYEPCKPSLYRGEQTKERLFERSLQLADFKSILQENPQVKDLEEDGLIVNYEALAQHYGIATNMMDMTNSPLVAAFFATTRYDASTDTYSPMLNYVSMGIIYLSPWGDLFNTSEKNRIWPIGQEALKRPGEQRAFAMVMDKGSNFDMASFRFWHSREASLKVWKMTKGGTMFFPYDPMVEKILAMKKKRIYSLQNLEKIYNSNPNFADSLQHAKQIMEKEGCTFVDYLPFAYRDAEVTYLNEEYRRMYPGSFT